MQVDRSKTDVFPTQCSIAFDAIDVSDGVLSGGHWTIIGFAFDDVDTEMMN